MTIETKSVWMTEAKFMNFCIAEWNSNEEIAKQLWKGYIQNEETQKRKNDDGETEVNIEIEVVSNSDNTS